MQKKTYWIILLGGLLSILPQTVYAQSKMDLDDLQIKGELHNDDRLRLLAREKNKLKNFVKFRTDFRSEITQGLRKPAPKVKYFPAGTFTP
ncbi:MAG: hypothetical protein KDD61_09970 [Bdellovibrionales bacterium]|nr:hypothetical protein [Bdellovibrionales bacterium]